MPYERSILTNEFELPSSSPYWQPLLEDIKTFFGSGALEFLELSKVDPLTFRKIVEQFYKNELDFSLLGRMPRVLSDFHANVWNVLTPHKPNARQAFMQDVELALNKEVIHTSFGISLPSYIRELKKLDMCADTQVALVGALTHHTIDEFAYTVSSTLPGSVPVVIEPTMTRVQHAAKARFTLHETAGQNPQLAQIFGNKKLDVIMTNYLIPSACVHNPEGIYDCIEFWIQELLSDNGALIMIENESDVAYMSEWIDSLKVPHVKVYKKPVSRFHSRRAMFDWMKEPNSEPLMSTAEFGLLLSVVKQ